jgi:hypothetical protein
MGRSATGTGKSATRRRIYMLLGLGLILLSLALALPAGAFAFISTGDGGWFWQNPLPQGNALGAVTFPDATHGWAVGDYGTILATTDGGATWSARSSGISDAFSPGSDPRPTLGPSRTPAPGSCRFSNFLATRGIPAGPQEHKVPANQHNALVAQWIEHRFPKSAACGPIRVHLRPKRVNPAR